MDTFDWGLLIGLMAALPSIGVFAVRIWMDNKHRKPILPLSAPQTLRTTISNDLPKDKPLPREEKMGYVVGWKRIGVDEKGQLISEHGNTPWPMYAPMVAKHLGDGDLPHDSPNVLCYCGINAYKAGTIYTSLVLEVALSGRVIYYEHGYRAEMAYPMRLLIFGTASKDVRQAVQACADAYGIHMVYTPEQLGVKGDHDERVG